MLYTNKNYDSLEKNEVASLQSQVEALKLQDNLGKQNFYEDMKKVFELVTKSIKDVSQYVTRATMETSEENDKALEKLNDKLLEILNDRCIIATYLMSPLSTVTNPAHTIHFKLIKVPHSTRVNDF